MSKTLEVLREYLELLDITKKEKKSFFERKDIQMYCRIRDNLTYSEILELSSVLNDIVNKVSSYNNIDLNRFLKLSKNSISKINNTFELQLKYEKDIILGLSTIIVLEPKEIILNYYDNL